MKRIIITIAAIIGIAGCCGTVWAQEKVNGLNETRKGKVCKPTKDRKGTVCYTSNYAKNYKVGRVKNNSYTCGKMTATNAIAAHPVKATYAKTKGSHSGTHISKTHLNRYNSASRSKRHSNSQPPEAVDSTLQVYSFESKADRQELPRNVSRTNSKQSAPDLAAPQNQSYKNVNLSVK